MALFVTGNAAPTTSDGVATEADVVVRGQAAKASVGRRSEHEWTFGARRQRR